MPPRKDQARLLDMLIGARRALQFVENMTYEEFLDDERTKYAVVHACLSSVRSPTLFQNRLERHLKKSLGPPFVVFAIVSRMNISRSTI